MMDPFDSMLRQRITRLLVAVPTEPIPQASRPRPMAGRRMLRKRLILAVGLGLLILASLAVSLPAMSRPTYEARLRDLGVPAGVEIITAGADANGNLMDVVYRDKDGHVHCVKGVGGCYVSITDPSRRVLYDGGPGPKATPTP